eukprot:scaffold64226_cov32-Tisochrysis_lutea.AAC.2
MLIFLHSPQHSSPHYRTDASLAVKPHRRQEVGNVSMLARAACATTTRVAQTKIKKNGRAQDASLVNSSTTQREAEQSHEWRDFIQG